MDFVLNGPRLQVGLIDGFENRGGSVTLNTLYENYRNASLNSSSRTRFSYFNMLRLVDTWDGRQLVSQLNWYNGDTGNDVYPLSVRFAVQSTDPNVYLCVSLYGVGSQPAAIGTRTWMMQVSYHDLTKQLDNFASSKTVTVTLPLSEWWPIFGDQPPQAYDRRNSYVFTGKTGTDMEFPSQLQWNNANNATMFNLSNPGSGYVSRAVTATDVTYTFEFPANANIIRQAALSSSPFCVWDVLPINMRGRKFGNEGDTLPHSTKTNSESFRSIAKVYSPTKGCLALKSFLNGEIPILNE